MNIGILGTGMVGQALAARLAELGHTLVVGTRHPAATLAKREAGPMGNPPFQAWLEQNPGVRLGSFAEAAAHGELVVNATNGSGSLAALQAAGEANLDGKVLVDVSNPLDGSRGMPPVLFVSNTDSLAEQIQAAYPRSRVVKTLNTVNARVMVYPRRLAEGRHSVFVSGNDPQAKDQVSGLLRSFGWEDIIDLGDITTARGPEMYLPLWLRLWGALGSGLINVQVVR
jgi:predicted dinucleotide-binding enzyme